MGQTGEFAASSLIARQAASPENGLLSIGVVGLREARVLKVVPDCLRD